VSDAQIDSALSSAEDAEAQAADWLQRRHFWNWSDADQVALDAWLGQSPAHLVAYLRLEAALSRTDRLAALRFASGDAPELRKPGWPILAGIAAALILVATLGAGAFYFLQPGERTYATSVGGRELVTFEDGSKIELNTSTILRASMTTKERLVWLDKGEAYFQVKHDAAHPFVVMVGDRRVTDLGTKFFIRRETGSMEVGVVQGRVWFDTPDKQTLTQTAFLTQGDVAMVAANKISMTRKSVEALTGELTWRQGILVFHHTPLQQAANELNRYNHIKLVIGDAAAAKLTMNGSFPANDVSAFTEAARDVFGLRVENRGNEIVISH